MEWPRGEQKEYSVEGAGNGVKGWKWCTKWWDEIGKARPFKQRKELNWSSLGLRKEVNVEIRGEYEEIWEQYKSKQKVERLIKTAKACVE